MNKFDHKAACCVITTVLFQFVNLILCSLKMIP